MTDPHHNINPYYSKTDTTKLNLPNPIWKKVLPYNVLNLYSD